MTDFPATMAAVRREIIAARYATRYATTGQGFPRSMPRRASWHMRRWRRNDKTSRTRLVQRDWRILPWA